METDQVLDPTEQQEEPVPSLRETIEAAVDDHPETPEKLGEQPSEGAVKATPETTQAKPATDPSQSVKPETSAKAEKPVAPGELRAPAQWKPEVREHWNKLPRAVQEEVIRREGDNLRLIGSVGPKIRVADEVANQLQPFVGRLQENGVAPMTFVNDLFTTAKALAGGDPMSKAEVVANIVQSYGVDLRALDAALTKRVSAPPEVHQARQMMTRMTYQQAEQQAAQEQQGQAAAEQAIAEFEADPKHEFLGEVRNMMADLVESGKVSSLEDAYTAAIWANPNTRRILLQREAQSRVATKSKRAEAARRASSAIHGTPSFPVNGAGGEPNMSLRQSIEAAIDEHSSL
jgi:hypothetical protein